MDDADSAMSDAPAAAPATIAEQPMTDDPAPTAASSTPAAVTVADARPSTQRARSSGGGRALAASRLTPAAAAALTAAARKSAAAAANQARAEVEATRRARQFTDEEHGAAMRSMWMHGLESHEAAHNRRELQPHPATLAALPSKTASEVASYLRLWLWRCVIVPFAFASEAMRKAGVAGWKLNTAFVEELRQSHSLAPVPAIADEEADAPDLVTQELSIPSFSSTDAAPASQSPHIVLSRWVARLRRCMLLSQMGNDASAVVASLQPLHLRYTAECIDLLPRAKWTARDDAELLVGARTHGYESLQPALMQARCDFLCDAFHAHCLEQARKQSEAQDLASARSLVLAASHAPVAAASASVVPVPASFSSPVWNGALVRKVFAVLTTHGLPTHSYTVAADTKLKQQAEAAAAAAAGTAAPLVEFVCPVCPLLDWTALYSLLSLHTGLQFDARWQRPLSALLSHVCVDFEVKARGAIGGLHGKENMLAESSEAFDLPQSDLSASSSSSLCPAFLSYAAIRSFRRSCLFFHQLRVRILDPAFHGFANGDAGVLEWVSQFAPGLTAPAAAPSAVAATEGSKVGATLEAVHAEPAADYGRIVDGSASLLCSTPYASASLASAAAPASPVDAAAAAVSAAAASNSSSMPSWYQIGFHDLCLLKSVSAWGLDLNAAFFERLNADFRRPLAAAVNGADSQMRDASSATSADAPLSNLHWQDSGSWLAHSRAIIRQRMGESAAAPVSPGQPVEPLPAVTAIEPHNHVALIKRAAQLVQSLAAVSTDEVCNRLLHQVQVSPASSANGAAATNGASAAAASAAPSLPFSLTAAGAASLAFFQHSLCGYQMQRPIYTLLRTRYHDLAPPSAAVAARLAAAAAKRYLSLHSSPAAAIAAARALGLSLVAPSAAVAAGVSPEDAASGSVGEGPENPLKLSDAAFLRPMPSATLMAAQIAARFPRGVATPEGFAATSAAAAAAAPRVKREQEDEMADDDLVATADDAAAGEEQAARSRFAEMLDAERKRAALSARITTLMGEDASAPCTVPWPLFVSADARLVLPQQLGPGFVLHALGALSPRHVVHSARLIAARSAALAMDDAESSSVAAGQRSHQLIVLFPVGYRAVVRHASYKRADRLALYLCEILSAAPVASMSDAAASASSSAELQFRVTASDDPLHPIVASSAQAAWEAVCVAIAQMEGAESAAALSAAKSKRATAPAAAAAAAAVDGVSRFGLDRPGVLLALAAEVRADPAMQRALTEAFSPKQLSAHAAAIYACQFYSCPTAAVPTADTGDAAAFTTECSHHLLRLHRLTASLVAPSAHPTGGPVYSASSSSVVALQAAALREHQLSAAHAAHQQQQHQIALAQQQAQMRQRMEEEMAAAQQAAAQAAAAAYYPSPYGFVHPQHWQQQQAQVAAAAAAAAAAAQGYHQMQ